MVEFKSNASPEVCGCEKLVAVTRVQHSRLASGPIRLHRFPSRTRDLGACLTSHGRFRSVGLLVDRPGAVSRATSMHRRRSHVVCLALAAALAAAWPASPAAAQCSPVATNQTCTNPAGTTISQIFDFGTLTATNLGTVIFAVSAVNTTNVTNSGTIGGVGGATINLVNTNSGDIEAVVAVGGSTVNVTNAGTIHSTDIHGLGISATGVANVTNSGLIVGGQLGIIATVANVTNSEFIGANGTFSTAIGASDTAIVINSGMIQAPFRGISAPTVIVTNSATGTISAQSGFAIDASTANVTNSGSISGLVGINATTANIVNSGMISGQPLAAINVGQVANITNSGTISGPNVGILAGTANVNNSGTISGQNSFAISAQNATVTNSGTISSQSGIGIGGTTVTVTNSGSISGLTAAISATTANIANSGTISGRNIGLLADTANVNNAGTITGQSSFGISARTATVTNSGTISGHTGIVVTASSTLVNAGAVIGTGGTAIDFSASSGDTLRFLNGSRVNGLIALGAHDSVSFGSGNWVYSFGGPNGLATATISAGGAPVAAAGSQIAVLDPTPFGLADKDLMDFTRAISAIVGAATDSPPASSGPSVSAFAPTAPNTVAALAEDAFAGILAYGGDAMVFKNPTVVASDGRSAWARGFIGERVQQADGASLHATTNYAGGAGGFDLLARPDLRLGVFAGGGQSRLAIALNAGRTDTDTVFGGLYGRYAFMSFGAPSVVDFALHGGGSTNGVSRTIANNLAAGGIEVATARYDSRYVSPELGYRIHLPLWAQYTLTPSLRFRYVAGFFDGYTEGGSSANLTVTGRTIQDLEERGELKLTHITSFASGDSLLTSAHVGALGVERLGDTTINTVLLGVGLPFLTPGRNSVAGVLGGLGFEWRTREGVSFFAVGEYTAMSDQSTNVDARGGVRVAF
jgi:uncharacterized protein with beta-barrel porin domain